MAKRKESSFDTLFDAMSVMNFEVGANFYAKPTHIVDPHDFYIIPFPFLYYLSAISKPGKPLPIHDLKENMIVIYTSKKPDVNHYFKIELDENIRGVIQSIDNDNNCQIYALDRGFVEENVPLECIFQPAHQEAINTPSLVQHCELDICVPIGPKFSKEAIEAFRYYIGNEKLSIVVRGKSTDKLKILVYNSNPDDIASLLALTHFTYLTYTIRDDIRDMALSSPHLSKLSYRHEELNIGDTLTVRVQSGSSLNSFYVSPISKYQEYVQNRSDFTNYCKSISEICSEDFVPSAVIGVKDEIDRFYERAVILEILEADFKAKVKLVDWGTELEVYKNGIKAIKANVFVKSPVAALHCCAVKGFEPWDNGLSKFLYKGYSFSIKVERVGRGFEIPNIVSIAQI